MKILAMSDTHIKDGDSIPEFLTNTKDFDMILHAGDFSSRQFYEFLNSTGKLKAVHGNSDERSIKKTLPERLVFEVDGIKIGVVHVGSLSINDTTALKYLAMEMDVKILIFGHFHRPLIDEKDVILICPGSPTKPRMSNPTYVVIDIQDGIPYFEIREFEGHCCSYLEFLKKLDEEK